MTPRSLITLVVALLALGLVVFFAQQDGAPTSTSGGPILPDLQAALDDELIRHCHREGRALVTLDLDSPASTNFLPSRGQRGGVGVDRVV